MICEHPAGPCVGRGDAFIGAPSQGIEPKKETGRRLQRRFAIDEPHDPSVERREPVRPVCVVRQIFRVAVPRVWRIALAVSLDVLIVGRGKAFWQLAVVELGGCLRARDLCRCEVGTRGSLLESRRLARRE